MKSFFVLAFPLILLFFAWRSIKQMRKDGFLPSFIAACLTVGSTMGLSFYYLLAHNGNVWICILINISGVSLWAFVDKKFTSKYYKEA
tara:strand:+ start:885 stop:1148 length:264 start_codon:yes stop_codon:yes gene_type:complete